MNAGNPQRESFISLGNQLKDVSNRAKSSIEITDETGLQTGWLVPLDNDNSSDAALIDSFVRWRTEHQYAYSSRFEVTHENTSSWVKDQVVNNPRRIMFLVADANRNLIGRIALLDTDEVEFALEIDNVLRGEAGAPGLFTNAMITLERWAATEFALETISLEVLQSNENAVSFYNRLGYEVVKSLPMKWVDNRGITSLQPSAQPDEVLLVMNKKLDTRR